MCYITFNPQWKTALFISSWLISLLMIDFPIKDVSSKWSVTHIKRTSFDCNYKTSKIIHQCLWKPVLLQVIWLLQKRKTGIWCTYLCSYCRTYRWIRSCILTGTFVWQTEARKPENFISIVGDCSYCGDIFQFLDKSPIKSLIICKCTYWKVSWQVPVNLLFGIHTLSPHK